MKNHVRTNVSNNVGNTVRHSATNRSASSARKQSRKSRARRCIFRFADGRRCRLAPAANPFGLCRHHVAQASGSFRAEEDLSRDLASLSGHFRTSSDINHVLGKLWRLFSQGRIPRRDAVALAYIGQLILQSLPSVQGEIRQACGHSAWAATLQQVFRAAPHNANAPANVAPAAAATPATRAPAPPIPSPISSKGRPSEVATPAVPTPAGAPPGTFVTSHVIDPRDYDPDPGDDIGDDEDESFEPAAL